MALNPIENQIRELSLEQPRKAAVESKKTVPDSTSEGSFEDILGRLVHDVDSLQKAAGETINDFVTEEGDASTGVTKKMQDADAAYNLMMQIRHKLVDVYSAVDKADDKA